MLSGSKNAGGGRGANEGGGELADLMRIFTPGTRIDDGVLGVGVYVGDGKKIPLHSDSPRFLCGDAREGLSISRIPGRGESHGVREDSGAVEAIREAAFKVGGEEQGQVGI